MNPSHQLAAILFTDIVNCTELMQRDEEDAIQSPKKLDSTVQNFTKKYFEITEMTGLL